MIYAFEASGDYKPTFISQNIKELLGYEREEYLESPDFWRSRVHPADLARIEKGYTRLFEEGHLSNEYRFRKKDGNYCWISDDLQLIRNAVGDPIEIIGAWNDITARKQLSEVLVAAQDRLVRLLSSAPAVIYSYKASGDFAPIIISENIKNVLGYEPSEYLENADFWRSRVHPDDLARVEAESSNLYKNGRHTVEYRFLKKDGTYCWVNDEQHLIRHEGGQPIEVIGSWSDVTRRKSAEAASRRSEQRLTDAIELISKGFSLYDADDRLVICNSAYRELLYPGMGTPAPGTPYEALIRNAVALGLVEDARGRAEEWIAARLTRHRQPGEPHVQRRSDGHWIHVNERRTTEGGTVAVYSNITEIKRAEEEIRAAHSMVCELVAIFGRRAGKTTALAVFDCWIAALCDHRDVLAPGEVGVALVISRDQRAAKITIDRIDGILSSSIILNQLIANRTADSIELTNGIVCEVRPANRVSARGATLVSVVAEEVAHFFTAVDFANPDVEILAAVRPGLLTTHGPLLMASSVYAKHGVLFDSFKRYFGPDGPPDVLVAYGTSRDLNPSLSQAEIDRELERDPVRNRAEYLSEWRSDVEGFIPREIVEACVRDYHELPPQPGIAYRCFVDPASGVPEGDSFAAVVSHKLGDDRVTIDAVREVQPPFNFFEVVETVLLPLCKAYHITKIVGDNYGGDLAKLPVRKAGISYELSAKHTSQLYLDPFLGMLNAGKIDLPRNQRAVNQICSLERSALRSGRDQITHPTRGHDDIACAIAGAVDIARGQSNYSLEPFAMDYRDSDLPPLPEPEPRAPVRANGDWWKSMPRAQPTFSADQRLRSLYNAIDMASKSGFLK